MPMQDINYTVDLGILFIITQISVKIILKFPEMFMKHINYPVKRA